MRKKNCWEIKQCGREKGGKNVDQFGVCKAVIDSNFDGINHGKNGGRCCWAIAGTLCGGEVQGTFAEKRSTCLSCDVFKVIKDEEGLAFVLKNKGLKTSV